ncbi:MAG TPA: response regulator transcription factor [Gaiellaceae bacterium]|jgi:DNA-binding NarL/FixJ family response regulator|nr:response regulator transcription factor [Gaiellaceae bacterium]
MVKLEDRTTVLVDEHPLWLDTVAKVVSEVGIRVVGKATRSSEALRFITEHSPDLVITGIRMPDDELDGISLVREALTRRPEMKAIVLSMYDDAEHVDASFAAGVSAYVLKSTHPDDLKSAIRQAFEPSVYYAAETRSNGDAPLETPEDVGLTRRELEILQIVAEGHSNAELAKMLWVTEQTVKFHLSNIYRKLNVANRTEASRWAQRHGLLVTSHTAVSSPS